MKNSTKRILKKAFTKVKNFLNISTFYLCKLILELKFEKKDIKN